MASCGLEAQVFATGEEFTVISADTLDESDPLRGHLHAAFVAPILFKGTRRGVLVLAQQDDGKPFFSAVQLQIARVVGEYLGIVAAMTELQSRRESEQRALRELEIAAEIQMSLMPQQFAFNDCLDIYGHCLPALQAGGDYFDLIALPGGGIFLVIADVMGKGISAALLANMLRTHIRAKLDLAEDPGALLTAVNRAITPDLTKLEMFITVACGWVAPSGAEIRQASAGHTAGLLCTDGRVDLVLESQGMPIGILEETDYESRRLAIRSAICCCSSRTGSPKRRTRRGIFTTNAGLEAELKSAPSSFGEGRGRARAERGRSFRRSGPPTRRPDRAGVDPNALSL